MRYCLLFLLLVSLLFAASDCGGYVDEFDVRVLDAKLRPVEGASVHIKFDRGTSFGEQYFTTEPKLTGSDGTASFKIINQNTTTRDIDCTIWIYVDVGGESEETTVEANAHGPTVDVTIPVYKLTFRVEDQYNEPLENASIYFLGRILYTDEDGYAYTNAKKQTTDYLVNCQGGEEAGTVTIADDTTQEVVIPIYEITVNIVDDFGDTLPATVHYLNESYETDGSLSLTVYTTEVEITVEYGGMESTVYLYPEEDGTELISFDIHAPVIGEREETLVGDRTRMTIEIKDEGIYAEGVDPSTVEVRYRVLPDGGWTTASAFVVSLHEYGVDFPEVDEGQIVEFLIQAEDYNGNKVSQEGRFTVQKEEEPEVNESGDEQENGEEPQEFPLIYIFFGVIFIIIVFYIVKFIKQNVQRGV